MNLGCHLSVSKGLYNAAVRAESFGAKCFQVFTKNPRALRSKNLDQDDAAKGNNFCKEHDITIVTHTPYVTNLSTPKEDLHALTVRSIREDLSIAEAYGAIGAVVHCGKHVGEGEEYGKQRMIETLDSILEDYEGEAKLLLENTAGQGTELGTTLEELVELRFGSKYAENIGFCFDTCHAFAAGEWMQDSLQQLVEKMKITGYLDDLVVVHFNDSKVPFGSRKDRHQKIGKGEIGLDALSRFFLTSEFSHLPFVLETPVEDEKEYIEEMLMLNQVYSGAC